MKVILDWLGKPVSIQRWALSCLVLAWLLQVASILASFK